MRDLFVAERQKFFIIGCAAIFLILGWSGMVSSIFGLELVLLSALIGGFPIVSNALKALLFQGQTKIGLLVSIAIVAAVLIGEYIAAAEVALIMLIGDLLETYSVKKSSRALESLLQVVPQEANRVDPQDFTRVVSIPRGDVVPGDLLLVKAGERVPVDGRIVKGATELDEAPLTGESKPVAKDTGNQILGGSLNCTQAFYMKAEKVGDDSLIGKIVAFVEEARSNKAPVQRLIDRVAGWFVPVSLSLALLVFVLTGDIVRSVTVLIVLCPCGMLLSTPTAIMTGVGRGAQLGILIKGAQALEKIKSINAVIFDKTGTLTRGQPELYDLSVRLQGITRKQLLNWAATAEATSSHPVAQALRQGAAVAGLKPSSPDSVENVVGKGVIAQIKKNRIIVGNEKMLQEENIVLDKEEKLLQQSWSEQGCTVLFLLFNGQLAGIMAVNDPVRQEAKGVISRLQAGGLNDLSIATGDARPVAEILANTLGITSVYAEVLPEEKWQLVREKQEAGKHVMMVGDGINDAPALMQADIGVAMGKTGTDVAVEAADIALLADRLDNLPLAIELSKRTTSTIYANLWLANGINLLALLAAVLGWIGPVAAAVLHNAGAILVVLNSLRLYRFQQDKKLRQFQPAAQQVGKNAPQEPAA